MQGGAIKGTTISQGDYGVRLLESVRLSAAVLGACRETIRRKLRPLKGTKFWMRVFPDQPICVKGNEVRMGKGKGSLEFWASRRAPLPCRPSLPLMTFRPGCRLDECCTRSEVLDSVRRLPSKVGHGSRGTHITSHRVASNTDAHRTALKLVQSKLPVRSEFITKDAAPRLGRVTSSELNEVDPREANLILPEFTSVVNQGRAPSSGSMGLQTTAL